MLNWIYYQIAMYYLRKARNVPNILWDDKNMNLWERYINQSNKWIAKVKP